MVFSQTSHKTQSILKVVEIDRLKANKSQQDNNLTGVITGGVLESPSSPMASTSFAEDYLKPEPLFDNTMFHESDCEFFQDLVQWCSTPAKEEQVQIIDCPKINEEKTNIIQTTTYTPFSSHGWEKFDANSPNAAAGFYNSSPIDPLSPTVESFSLTEKNIFDDEVNSNFKDKFLDISSLPVVIGDIASENTIDMNPWQKPESFAWPQNAYETNNIRTYSNTQNTIFNNEENFVSQFNSVIPRELENNDVVISEYIMNENHHNEGTRQQSVALSVDVEARASSIWLDNAISTPEILTYVEQLEREKPPQSELRQPSVEIMQPTFSNQYTTLHTPLSMEYNPITPKSESHVDSENDDSLLHLNKKRHRNSEDSDETYTPYSEQTPKKQRRKRPNVPIKDMILTLEGSQQLTKSARRGRPPKRRISTVSSVCSLDDNSSAVSTQETKYRELRDKNNEASKRSRMNRKLKELQMDQLAEELEEKNKKLKVKADILEEMTKKLKDALMTAILKK